MTRARDLAVVAGLLLWWSPAGLAVVCVMQTAGPSMGWRYRVRRVHRLLDRGRVDEAARVVAALHRELDAWDRWCEANRT